MGSRKLKKKKRQWCLYSKNFAPYSKTMAILPLCCEETHTLRYSVFVLLWNQVKEPQSQVNNE